VRDEARRSLTKELLDLSTKLKSEHDEALALLQNDLQDVSIQNVALESPLRVEARESYEIGHKLATESRKGLFRFNCNACTYLTNKKGDFQTHLKTDKHRTNSPQAETRNGAVVAAEAGADADSSGHDATLGKRTRCSDSAAPSGSLELQFTIYK
jgi:hypothetical protein